jgi:hypothetical protein
MHGIKCPTCSVQIPAHEVAAGWCENCGKQIPSYALEESGGAVQKRIQSDCEAAAVPESKGTFGGWALAFGFIVLGAIVSIALEKGKTNWLWLGCAVGGGLGVFVAQKAGLLPRAQR